MSYHRRAAAFSRAQYRWDAMEPEDPATCDGWERYCEAAPKWTSLDGDRYCDECEEARNRDDDEDDDE